MTGWELLKKKLTEKSQKRLQSELADGLSQIAGKKITDIEDRLVKKLSDIIDVDKKGRFKENEKQTKDFLDHLADYAIKISDNNKKFGDVQSQVTDFVKHIENSLSEIKGSMSKEKPTPLPKEFKIAKPVWFKQFEFPMTDFFVKLKTLLTELSGKTQNVRATGNEDPKQPIYVRLVDDNGKAIKVPFIVEQTTGGGAPAGGGGLNSENLTAIKEATENSEDSLDNIETEIDKLDTILSYISTAQDTDDGNIIAAPGAGKALKIHHIFVNNHGANFTKFKILDGSGGDAIRDYGLAAEGGLAAENLKRPIQLTANTALYYDYESGASADISIAVHYEEIDV